jgi:hypothetical protein
VEADQQKGSEAHSKEGKSVIALLTAGSSDGREGFHEA